jgi:hypothetical protein
MKLLFAILFVAVADRLIPCNVRRVAGVYFTASRKEFDDRYDLVAFPRTLVAVLLCLSAGLDLVWSAHAEAEGYVMVFLALLYAVSVTVDTFKGR